MPVTTPYTQSNLCICTPNQTTQMAIFAENIASERSLGSISFLQFLKSRQNNGVYSITEGINAGNGKQKKLVITMDEPICPTFCDSAILCDQSYVGTTTGISCFEVSIGNPTHLCDAATGAPAAFSFKSADWKMYCDVDNDRRLQGQFAKYNKKLVEAVDKKLVAQLQTLIHASQSGYKLPFYTTPVAGQQPTLNPFLFFSIEEILRDGGISGDNYVVFGGKTVNLLAQHMKIATANTAGYDPTKNMTNATLYYDRNFDIHFPNQIVIIPMKTVQLATWNEFEGQAMQDLELLKDKTTVYPLGNGSTITIDYRWLYEAKCREYQYDPRVYAELFTAPKGGCIGDDNFNGIIVVENCQAGLLPVCP